MINYISIIIAGISLLVSVLSYLKTIENANLEICGDVYMTNQKIIKKTNKIVLTRNEDGSNTTTTCRPGTEINLQIINKGRKVAKKPVMIIRFEGIRVDENIVKQLKLLFQSVDMRDHMHGLGYYTTYQCTLGEKYLLFPRVPVNLNPLCLNNTLVGENAKIVIYIVADNAKTKKVQLNIVLSSSFRFEGKNNEN